MLSYHLRGEKKSQNYFWQFSLGFTVRSQYSFHLPLECFKLKEISFIETSNCGLMMSLMCKMKEVYIHSYSCTDFTAGLFSKMMCRLHLCKKQKLHFQVKHTVLPLIFLIFFFYTVLAHLSSQRWNKNKTVCKSFSEYTTCTKLGYGSSRPHWVSL